MVVKTSRMKDLSSCLVQPPPLPNFPPFHDCPWGQNKLFTLLILAVFRVGRLRTECSSCPQVLRDEFMSFKDRMQTPTGRKIFT